VGETAEARRPCSGDRRMSAVSSTTVVVNGFSNRVWRKGKGAPLLYFPGIGGLPKWIPFLDHLAEQREVIAPSLPGFPGAIGHDTLDTHLDWLLATHDLLRAVEARGADVIATSVSAALLADVAALWPELVARLVLIAPFGLFDAADPPADI
jgi:pimeloyl-ACP methyl ester carboxylesterase